MPISEGIAFHIVAFLCPSYFKFLIFILLGLVDKECSAQSKDGDLNPSKCKKYEREKKIEATPTALTKLVDSKRKKKKTSMEKTMEVAFKQFSETSKEDFERKISPVIYK